MTQLDGLTVTRDDERGVATITLDVPEKMNRVSMPARDQIATLFEEFSGDDSVRFVVLQGACEQAFTAGGDVAGFLRAEPEALSRLAWNVAAPERCPKPVIAKLRGYTFGVGFELALACDFRIAADDVQLAFPEVTIGMIPGSGGTQRLARLVASAARRTSSCAAAVSGQRRRSPSGSSPRSSRREGSTPRRPARGRALAPLAARPADGEARLEPRLRRPASARARARRPRLRTPADVARLPRGVEAFTEKRPPKFEGR